MSKKNCCANKKTSIGGQALIEGIMMRGPAMSAMAVRNPQGEIVLEKWETQKPKGGAIVKLPIIRGVVNFVSSMTSGYKCLMRSAEISGLDEIEDELKREKEEKKAKKAAKKAKKQGVALPEEKEVSKVAEDRTETAERPEKSDEEKKKGNAIMNAMMVIAVVLAVCLSVFLFIMLPTFVYKWLSELIPALKPQNPALASLVKSVFEGVIKIAVIVGYMAAVSLMKDIKRTFQYHGAEHKTIFCYEHGKELTVENVRVERRFHPRCGTSFLILMLLVSIFISFFIDPISILLTGDVPTAIVRTIIRLVLLPIVMGIGYELIKLAGRHDNVFTRIISAPGLWLQRITVLEPTDDMIECAITAFKEVIPSDESDNL